MLGVLPLPGVSLLLVLIWGFSVPLWSVFPRWGFFGFRLFSSFQFFPLIASGARSFLGSGSSPFFPVFTGFFFFFPL